MSAATPPPSRQIDRVEVTTASEVGSSHRQRQQASDDAVGWTPGDGDCVIATIAVADGHSDKRCARSHDGAAFVVAAARDLPPNLIDADDVTAALVADWRRRVDRHLAEHPLPAADSMSANPRLAYGSTAIICRITSTTITIVRIGDGDVIAVTADGRSQRLADPEHPPGDATQSISQPDAVMVARFTEIPAAAAPTLLVLATDGFDNAYPADSSMLRAATELATLRRESGSPIKSDVLSQWARAAANVSGDDATVAAVWIEAGR